MRRALMLLVWLFPPAFRERFGAEMIEQVEREHAEARPTRRPGS